MADDAVMIADYKTDQRHRATSAKCRKPYLRQLALYRVVLGNLYRDRPVRAALIWTAIPELMEVPAEMLDQELVNLTGELSHGFAHVLRESGIHISPPCGGAA